MVWVRLPPRSIGPVVQRHDTSPTCWKRWFNSIRDHFLIGLQVYWWHAAVVRRKAGFDSRVDLLLREGVTRRGVDKETGILDCGAACYFSALEATRDGTRTRRCCQDQTRLGD